MYASTTVPIIILFCSITLTIALQYDHDPSAQNLADALLGYDPNENDIDIDSPNGLNKRSERYAFGLGRRAYHYTTGGSGVKRLPIYNFGLGKRARPYSFGLGKRMMDNGNDDGNGYPGNDAGNFEQIYGQTSSFPRNQRNRPYSFGLGKRGDSVMNAMERRIPQGLQYNFGLGKRFSPEEDQNEEHKVEKRSPQRPYNFGLGKR